MTGNIGS